MSAWVEFEGDKIRYLRVADQRASLMVDLLKAWVGMNALGEIINQAHEQPHKEKATKTVDDLVYLAAITAEKAFDEIERRGWMIALPHLFGEEK